MSHKRHDNSTPSSAPCEQEVSDNFGNDHDHRMAIDTIPTPIDPKDQDLKQILNLKNKGILTGKEHVAMPGKMVIYIEEDEKQVYKMLNGLLASGGLKCEQPLDNLAEKTIDESLPKTDGAALAVHRHDRFQTSMEIDENEESTKDKDKLPGSGYPFLFFAPTSPNGNDFLAMVGDDLDQAGFQHYVGKKNLKINSIYGDPANDVFFGLLHQNFTKEGLVGFLETTGCIKKGVDDNEDEDDEDCDEADEDHDEDYDEEDDNDDDDDQINDMNKEGRKISIATGKLTSNKKQKKQLKITTDHWEKLFSQYPVEFRQHIFIEKKNLYEYTGEAVLLTKSVCEFVGEKQTSRHFCIICKKLFKRVPAHMRNVHGDNETVLSILALASKAEKDDRFKQLIRKADYYCNNAKALSSQRGVVIPSRKCYEFRPLKKMMTCTRCYTLIEIGNYNTHITRCPASRNMETLPKLWEGMQEQFKLLPADMQKVHCEYLTKILARLCIPGRMDFCIRDNNVREYLVSQTLVKVRGYALERHVRSQANILCRFLQPLLVKLDIGSTSELLKIQNAQVIFDSLAEFGGIQDFFDNPETFLETWKAKEKGSGRAQSHNIRNVNPCIKAIAQYNRMRLIKNFGIESTEAKDATGLLNYIMDYEKWDKKLFTPLGLQRKFDNSKSEATIGMIISYEEKQQIISAVKSELMKLTGDNESSQTQPPPLPDHFTRILHYSDICDCVSTIIMLENDDKLRRNCSAITKNCWRDANDRVASERRVTHQATDHDIVVSVARNGTNDQAVSINVSATLISTINHIIEMQPAAGVNEANPFIFGKIGEDEVRHRDSTHYFIKSVMKIRSSTTRNKLHGGDKPNVLVTDASDDERSEGNNSRVLQEANNPSTSRKRKTKQSTRSWKNKVPRGSGRVLRSKGHLPCSAAASTAGDQSGDKKALDGDE